MREPTTFEHKVYEAVKKIPRGRVTTYKLLAACVGCGSAQAVGQALRRNPFAPRVPCHRVIASDLGIGGFAGRTAGREILRKLAHYSRKQVIDYACCHDKLNAKGKPKCSMRRLLCQRERRCS